MINGVTSEKLLKGPPPRQEIRKGHQHRHDLAFLLEKLKKAAREQSQVTMAGLSARGHLKGPG